MKYIKKALSIEEQADLLLKRGMKGNRENIIRTLAKVNYYKLSVFWKKNQNKDESFKENTHFDNIIYLYTFDCELRNIIFEAVGNIEILLKTEFANYLSIKLDPFFYTHKDNLPGLSKDEYQILYKKIKKECKRSREVFIKHFNAKYATDHELPPIWMIVEVISFGAFAKIAGSIDFKYGKKIAKNFNINYKVLRSWIWSINEVRNICAHHARIWNRILGNKPIKPRFEPFKSLDNSKIFFILLIFLWLDKDDIIERKWIKKLLLLIEEYNEIDVKMMGFVDDWREIIEKIET